MSHPLVEPPLPSSASHKPPDGQAKPRVDFVDYAKGLGILLVVVAHVWLGLERNGIDVPGVIRKHGLVDRWVYGFHMPVFFFVSGLFLYRSAAKPAAGFVLDKLSSLVWPFLVWSVIYWAAARVLKRSVTGDDHSLRSLLTDIANPVETHLWFLYTLFLIAMAILALRKARVPAWAAFVGSLAVTLAIRAGHLDFGGQFYKFAMFLPYVTGAALAAPWLMAAAQRWPAWAWALLAVIGGGGVTAAAVLNTDPDPMFGRYAGWAGILLTVALARLLEIARFHPLKWVGLLSLEIYLVHILAISLVRTVLVKVHVTAWPIHLVVDSIAGLLGPIVLALICRRIGFPWLFRFRGPTREKQG